MRFSLRQRYLLAMLPLLVASVCCLSAALLLGQSRTMAEVARSTSRALGDALREQFAMRGRGVALVTAEALVNPVSLLDIDAVRVLLRAARADPDVAYVRVYDAAGAPLHDDGEAGPPGPGPGEAPTPAADGAGLVVTELRGILDVGAPIRLGDQVLGTLRLGLRLDPIGRDTARLAGQVGEINRAQLRASGGPVAAVVLALLAAAGLSAAVMARRLSRPIVALSDLAARIGRGGLGEGIDVPATRRADELGDLARSLAAMARDLRETTVSRDQFDPILRSMRDGLVVATPEGVVTAANEAVGALLGRPAAELVGTGIVELVVDGRDILPAPDRVRPAANPLDSVEAALVGGGGQPRPVLLSLSPMRGADGDPRGIVCVFHDIAERKRAEAQIRHMAQHDALTGLPNRVLLQHRLGLAVARARRDGRAAILLLDLDRFKEVNDTLGHPAGDRLLREAAERLRACVREGDTVARLGGDEFAIVQTDVRRPEDVEALCHWLVEAVARPFHLDGRSVFVGTSIGVAAYPADGDDPDRLLRNADLALYQAKAAGRGTFRFFEEAMNARMQARKSLETDLRPALERGELELHYQPQIDLLSRELVGAEALLRWRHAGRGWVPPDVLIPLAEETGLIVPVGEWVLGAACAQAATWRVELGADLRVAVNLSPVQFARQDVAGLVQAALRETGLPPGLLELEITEGVVMQDSEAILDVLRRLRSLGVRLAMDDFGTGYSSLSYLRRFPFDTLKIDRSFVRDLESDAGAAAVVRAAVGLAHGLGIAPVAEGIETRAQLDLLEAEGCREAQGFYFGAPVPAGELARLLHRFPPRLPAAPASGPARRLADACPEAA